MRMELLRFNGAVEQDPAIDAWMKEHAGELGAIALQWFEGMRKCGDEVREFLHAGTRDFARLDVGSLSFAELLCFFKVDLLFHCDCTVECVGHW